MGSWGKKLVFIVVAGTLGTFAIGLYLGTRNERQDTHIPAAPGKKLSRDQWVEVGGVRRPITDIRANQPERQTETSEGAPKFDIGKSPPIPKDANPQVKSVVEAFETRKYPERVSSLILPKPFDKAAFEADPEKYLNTVEPGRIWQVAQPGPGVARLSSQSPRLQTAEQGELVPLHVKAVPGAPVTFTSFDLGAFENRLTSITVRADDDGIARVQFTGIPGTINDVRIMAASPLTSGQANFMVRVVPPRGASTPSRR